MTMSSATESSVSIALITGARGGIGLALVEALLRDERRWKVYAATRDSSDASELASVAKDNPDCELVELDLLNEDSRSSAVEQMQKSGRLDLVINTAGILHDADGLRPERRLAEVSVDNMARAFATNASGALMLAQSLEPLLKESADATFATLSARVGSISDNRLGGWYAYRASKAALNMVIRNLAIEWARLKPILKCVALHPGTVRTSLSKPFVGDKEGPGVFSPAEAASNLLRVIFSITDEQSGRLIAYDGKEISW